MQRKIASEIKVGILIAMGLTILVFLLVNSANWRRGIGGKILKARFNFVSNLKLGAPVHMSGVQVGRVIDIDLLKEGVEVTMRIKSPQPLREGCVVSIGYLGVVGETYVEIENGPLGNPPLPDKAVVKGRDPTSTAIVLSKAEKAVNTVIDLAKTSIRMVRDSQSNLQDAILKLTERLDKTLSSINQTLLSLRETSDELRRLASENRDRIARITSQIDLLSQRGAQDYDEIQTEVKSLLQKTKESITSTSNQLGETMLVVKDTAQSLRSIAWKLDRRFEEVESKLTISFSDLKERIMRELDSLQRTMDDLRSVGASFRETANRMNAILKTMEEDETIRRAHNTMSQVEQVAQDTSEMLRELRSEFNLVNSLDLKWNAGIRYTSTDSLISQMAFHLGKLKIGMTMVGDKQSYDLQYVKPFRIGTSLFKARIGAIRSKAGAGFDWWLSHRLGLTFDLSESNSRIPRIDTYLRLKLSKKWYLTFGGEDLTGKRGFSAGLMRDTEWK